MEHTQHTDQAGTVGGGARRRRPLLASLTTLGVVTGLLGVAGVFAAGSDTATTGENDIASGELEFPEADIQLASASFGLSDPDQHLTVECNDDWSDDLATGVLSGDVDQVEDYDFEMGVLCLRNAGTEAVDVAWSTFDVVDEELGCSFGEEDGACGDVGELSQHLAIDLGDNLGEEPLCRVATPTTPAAAQAPTPLVTLEPGQSVGLCTHAIWDGDASSQSDRVRFRILFEALSGGVEPPSDCVDDGFEDNDSFDAPTRYAGALSGQICRDDRDYFAYDHAGGSLDVLLQYAVADGDLDLRLLDALGREVDSSNSIDDDDEVSRPNLTAGTYVVEVEGYDGAEAPYGLIVTAGEAPPPPPACTDDEFEENDALSTAAPMGSMVTAIACDGDADHFAYQHDGGRFEAILDFDAPTVDLDLYLYDANGQQLQVRQGTTTDETIVVEDLPAGSYTLRVREWLDSGSAPYTLSVTPSIAPPPGGGGEVVGPLA